MSSLRSGSTVRPLVASQAPEEANLQTIIVNIYMYICIYLLLNYYINLLLNYYINVFITCIFLLNVYFY